MKKLLTILFVFISIKGVSQFPNNPAQSNASTNNIFNGAITGSRGLVAGAVAADTTAANLLNYIKGVPYIMINTTDGNLWKRNSTATGWVLIASSVGGVNIYNSNGTLTGNRVLSGANTYSIGFTDVTSFRAEPNVGGNQSLIFADTDSISLRARNTIHFATQNVERQTITAGGNVGIGTSSPGQKFHVSGGDILVRGTFSSGNTILSSTDPQMFFNTRKAAFRAGQVSSGEWDNGNVGEYSAAFGLASTASGQGAFAFSGGIASGITSIASGTLSEASGHDAMAIGFTTNANGDESFSAGVQTIAGSYSSFVLGRFNERIGTTINTWQSTESVFEIGIGADADNKLNAVTVLKNGKVGIGTSSPSVLLDVNGQIRMRTGATNGYIIQGDGNGVFSWVNPSSFALTTRDTIHVLVSGQSNANGFNDGAYDQTANPYCQAWNGTSWVVMQPGVQPMGRCTPTTLNSACGGTATENNATASYFYLAKRLQERTGKVVRVIVSAYGGAAIASWIPEGSTNFTNLVTQMGQVGNPHIDYFIWDQGESNSGTGESYKVNFDTLVAQLDRQPFFGKDVTILNVTVRVADGGLDQIYTIQQAISSGIYDRRYTLIEAGNEAGYPGSTLHFTAQAQYNIANKMIQKIYNNPTYSNSFWKVDAARRANIVSYVPNIGKGMVTMDSTTQALYKFDGTLIGEYASVNQPVFLTNISTPIVQSSTATLISKQTGGGLGESGITLGNDVASNTFGAKIYNQGLGVVGLTYRTSDATERIFWLEKRGGQIMSGNTTEFQMYNSGQYLAIGEVNAGITPKLYLGSSTTVPTQQLEVNGNIKYLGQAISTKQTVTYGTTTTWNWNAGTNAEVTLTGDITTFTITNAVAGTYATIRMVQDGTGSRLLSALPANSKVANGGAGAITLSTAPNAIDILTVFYDGSNYYWNYALNYN